MIILITKFPGYYVLCEIGVCSLATILSTVIIFIHERAETQNWRPPALILWIAKMKTPSVYIKQGSLQISSDSTRGKESKLNTENATRIQNSNGVACGNSLGDELLTCVRYIRCLIDDYRRELSYSEEKSKIWIKAFERIDLCLLIVLFVSNCVITIATVS